MPRGLDLADRKILAGAAAVAILLIGGTFALAPSARNQGSQIPSSYSSDSGGALAAYLLLVDLHYDVHRWEDTPARLTALGRGAILVLADPSETPSNQERRWLRDFVQNGGRILFCGPRLKAFFPEADVDPAYSLEWKESTALLPSYFSRGAPTIVLQPTAQWRALGASELVLYGDAGHATVVASRLGAGEILWWAGATPLSNLGIRRAGNLRLFLNAVSNPGAEPATIYWDEYFHGQRASLWSYVGKTPVAWGILQAAIIGLALLFSYGRRSGPIVTPAPVSRLSPLEFVNTIGSLYQSARAGSVAVAVSYHRLRLQLTQRLGLPAAISNRTLAEAAEGRLGWDASKFGDCMAQATVAEHLHRMAPAEALRLVQTLDSYSAQLGIRRTAREKI